MPVMPIVCFQCRSWRVERLRSMGVKIFFYRFLMGMKPFYCLDCGVRFFAKPKDEVMPLLWVLLGASVLFFVFDILLKYGK